MQISVMQQRAFTRAAILAVLVALATTQQCEYQVNDDNVINVPVSEKNGVVFMSDVYKSSREECQSACCDLEEEELDDGSYVKCNLAVFHHSGKPQKANCFLIYCPFEGSCVFSKVGEFSSSFLTYTPKPTEASVLNKPPSLKFTNPDASPLNLHKLVRRSNGQGKSPATGAPKDAKEKAGKEMVQIEGNLISMVEQQIKKAEAIKEAAGAKEEVQETTPKSPEKMTSSISTTTVMVDDGKNKKNQDAVVTTASTTKVNGNTTPELTKAQAEADVETTTETKEAQGSTVGPTAAAQTTSKQAPQKSPSTPQPTTSVKPTAPSLPMNSTPPGSETHLTSKSTSGSELEVEPSSSNTTHPPLSESSGANVSQPATLQPAKVSPDPPSTTPALNPSIKPTGSPSDSISNVTHTSTSLAAQSQNATEAISSSPKTSPSSSSNSPSTTSLPTHPTVALNASESSLETPISNRSVSNSTSPIAPTTAPSTPTSQTTLLHLTTNQSHITPDDSLTTIEVHVTESTQSSTLLPDDVNSPTIVSKVTPSPKLTSPSSPEPVRTIPSSVDDLLRKELEVNQTLAGNTTSAPLANETSGVGNETAAAAEIDTVEGEEDSAINSLIASNGALIAVVCFGVLFLLAVLVVIGKHWYEAYQRRHYSKVDYLINGMYN